MKTMESNSSTKSNLEKKNSSNIKSSSSRIVELFGDYTSSDDDDDDDIDFIPLTKWPNESDKSDMSTLLKSPIYSYNEDNNLTSLSYGSEYNNSTVDDDYNDIIRKFIADNSCLTSTPNNIDIETADLGLYDISTLCKDSSPEHSKILNEKLSENIPIELKEIVNSTGLNSPDLHNLYLNSTQFEEGALSQNNGYDQSASYCFDNQTSEISFNSFFDPYQSKTNTNESAFQLSNNISTSINTNSNNNLDQSQIIYNKELIDFEVMTSSQNIVHNSEINNASYESNQETEQTRWISSMRKYLDTDSTFLRNNLFVPKNDVNKLKQNENKSLENEKINAEPAITHNCIPVELELKDPNPDNLLTNNCKFSSRLSTSDNTLSVLPNEGFIRNFYESGSNDPVYNYNVISPLASTPEHKMVSSHDIYIPIQISNSYKNLLDVSILFQHQHENFDNSSIPNLGLSSSFEQQTYANPFFNIKNEVNSFNIENNYGVSTNKNINLYDWESSGYNSGSPVTMDNQSYYDSASIIKTFQSKPGKEKEDTLNPVLKKQSGRCEYSHENPFSIESEFESENEANIENVFVNFDETEDKDIKHTPLSSKLTLEDNEMQEQLVEMPLVLNSEDVKLEENNDFLTKYNIKDVDTSEVKNINKDNESSALKYYVEFSRKLDEENMMERLSEMDNSSTPNLNLLSSFEQQTYANPNSNIKTEVNGFNIENNYEFSTNKNINLYNWGSSDYNSGFPVTIDNQSYYDSASIIKTFQSEPGKEKEDTLNPVLKKQSGRCEYSQENPFSTECDLESEDEANIETEDKDIKHTPLSTKLTSEDNEIQKQVVDNPLVLNSEDVNLEENNDFLTKCNTKDADIFEVKYINKDNEDSEVKYFVEFSKKLEGDTTMEMLSEMDNSSTPSLSLLSSFEQQTYVKPNLNSDNTNLYDWESSGYNSGSPVTINNQSCYDSESIIKTFKSEPGIEKDDTLNPVLKKKGDRREYSHENPFLTESDLESEDETNIENVYENFDETKDEDIKPTFLNIKLISEDNENPEQVDKIPLVLKSEDVKLEENYDLQTKYNKKYEEIFEGKYINKDNESSALKFENVDIKMQDTTITRYKNKYDSKFDIDSEETIYFSELIKNSNGQFMKIEPYDELMTNIDVKYTNEEEGTVTYDFTDHKKVFPYYPYDAPPETLVDYPQSDDDEDYKKQYTCDGCRKMFLWARGLRAHATICKIVPQRIPDILSTSRICTDSPNTDTQENNTFELFDIIKKQPSSKLNFVTTAVAKDNPVDIIKISQELEKYMPRKIKREVENFNFGEDIFVVCRRSTRIMDKSNNGRVFMRKPNANKPIIKEEKDPIVGNSVSIFRCSKCNKGYKRKKNMLQHEESHSLDLKCTYCKKIYALLRTLNTHSKKCQKMPDGLREQLNATDEVTRIKEPTIKKRKI